MYQKPAMRVIVLQQRAHLLTGSGGDTFTNLYSEDDFIFGGSDEGYTGGAH